MLGRRPPHQHCGKRYTMTPSIPTADKAPFGTFPGYLAARLGGLETTHDLSQCGVYGRNTNFVDGDGDRDESVEIGPIGNTANLNVGALRETPVELRGNEFLLR